MKDTLEARLQSAEGRPSGFDYLRLMLAVSVVFWHSVGITYGPAFTKSITASPARAVIALILPLFFALSGFLVAGSLLRCRSLISFLGLRIIRIFPALAVETTISAILIGPLFSNYPLTTYIADPKFITYFYNMIGYIHFTLPGAFLNNPIPEIVNGQLWTVPFELECYVALAALSILGVTRQRFWILFALAAILSWETFIVLRNHTSEIQPTIGAVSGKLLVASFIAGVALYLYRDRTIFSNSLGAISSLATLGLLCFPPFGDIIAIIPAAYVTAWIGLRSPKRIMLIQAADYSYGIFLYGFVIQQAIRIALPGLNWIENFLVTIPIVTVISAFSWHFIELPALQLRTALTRFEGAVLAFLALKRATPLQFILAVRNKA